MRSLLLLVLFLSLYNCNQQERDCKDYKTGTFQFEYSQDGETKVGYIMRTETLQIEKYDNTIDSSEVRWINDCEVIFKTINPKRMVDKNDIHLKILTTTDSSYIFEYNYVGKNKKQKGTAFVSDFNDFERQITLKNKPTLYRILDTPFIDPNDSLIGLSINDGKINMNYKTQHGASNSLYNYTITAHRNRLTNEINHSLELINNSKDTINYQILENSETKLSLKYLPSDKIFNFSTKK